MRIHVHHVGKGLHSLKDNKVQGEGEMERNEEGLRGFIWELWKDPGEEQKRTDSNLHYGWGCGLGGGALDTLCLFKSWVQFPDKWEEGTEGWMVGRGRKK